MIQLTGVNPGVEEAPVKSKRKLNGKLYLGLLAIVSLSAAGYYWWHLHSMAQTAAPATAAHAVQATAASATAVATTAKAAAAKPVVVKAATVVAAAKPETKLESAKAAVVSFADSVAAHFVPSAKAKAAQPAPAVPRIQIVAPAAPAQKPQAPVKQGPKLTPEQQRLQHAAQIGFGTVMDLANKYPDTYGFGPDDVLSDAQLGSAIPVYRIAEKDRDSYETGQPLKPLLKSADEWVFPVMLDGQIRFMVRVKYTGHKYVPVSGSRALAMVYNKILDKWPASKGYHPELVANANLPDYYFTIPEMSTPNLTDTSEMFEYNPSLSPAAVILTSWR